MDETLTVHDAGSVPRLGVFFDDAEVSAVVADDGTAVLRIDQLIDVRFLDGAGERIRMGMWHGCRLALPASSRDVEEVLRSLQELQQDLTDGGERRDRYLQTFDALAREALVRGFADAEKHNPATTTTVRGS